MISGDLRKRRLMRNEEVKAVSFPLPGKPFLSLLGKPRTKTRPRLAGVRVRGGDFFFLSLLMCCCFKNKEDVNMSADWS